MPGIPTLNDQLAVCVVPHAPCFIVRLINIEILCLTSRSQTENANKEIYGRSYASVKNFLLDAEKLY